MQLEIVNSSATKADLYPYKTITVKKSNSKSCVLFSFSNNYIIQILACLLKHISLICVAEKLLNVWENEKYSSVFYVSKLSNNFLVLDLKFRQ